MSVRMLLIAIFSLAGTLPAAADSIVTCPALTQAVQVGSCASLDDLKIYYNAYCSDDKRMADASSDETCLSLENFRKTKDTALWEAGDFHGYLSCAIPAATIKAAKVEDISVSRRGTVTRVACNYEGGHVMALRTKDVCTVDGDRAKCVAAKR